MDPEAHERGRPPRAGPVRTDVTHSGGVFDACETTDTRVRTQDETTRNRRWRLPFLGLGLCLFAGALYGGLWRLGWDLPYASTLGELHGPLMICGFFGTLIGLERAVAIGKRWAFAAPLTSILAAAVALAGAPTAIAALLFAAAALVLASASLAALRDDPQVFTSVLAAGALCWAVGDIRWFATGDVPTAAPWWLLFLVLTIAAERLDMSRLLGLGRLGVAAFLVCVGLLIGGASLGMFDRVGAPLLGAGLVALSLWLARHDIAFRNLRRAPHLRYLGVCMSVGYLWMAAAGCALIFAPPTVAPYGYDLALHAILIGFVLSMAMGHSVIVIPAITGAAAPYHPAMYLGLGLLHLSVALRVCADLATSDAARMASGPLTIAALVAFGAVIGWRIRTTKILSHD